MIHCFTSIINIHENENSELKSREIYRDPNFVKTLTKKI